MTSHAQTTTVRVREWLLPFEWAPVEECMGIFVSNPVYPDCSLQA